MIKKIFLFCFVVMAVFSFGVCYAHAQSASDFHVEGDWVYVANEKGWTITAYSGHASSVEIPYQFGDNYVTQLDGELFANDFHLEQVRIPDTITVMGKNEFMGCVALKEVTILAHIKSLPDGTFKGCVSLETVSLPLTTTSIGKEAFAGCTHLKSITIPKNVSSIGEAAFADCTSLGSVLLVSSKLSTVQADAFKNTPWLDRQTDEFVYFGKKVLIRYNGNADHVEIPYSTVMISNIFEDNKTVESVVVPETVRRIGIRAFKNAENLRSINIPQYVTSVDANAFEGCSSLETVTIPNRVTSVGANAFNKCTKLKEIIFPLTVKSIQSFVAGNCPSLENVLIPETVTSINRNAFTGSDHVTIHVAPGSEAESLLYGYGYSYSYYNISNDDYICSDNGYSIEIIKYLGTAADVAVPQDIDGKRVTAIGTAAFQDNDHVRRIILPIGVVTIGSWAFSYMDKLESVQIPVGVKKLGDNAFTGSSELSEISLPPRMNNIGYMPFETAVKICTAENTDGFNQLIKMGYDPQPSESCRELSGIPYDWGMPYQEDIAEASVCDCGICINGGISMSRIPEGITVLTADLFSGYTRNLVILIPAAVTEIDPAILDEHDLTIVGECGTTAEEFAREHKLKFIVRINTWTGSNQK